MNLKFLDIINFITAFQLLFFAIFLLTKKKGNRLSHRLLALFFIVQCSCIMNTYTWVFYDFFYMYFPHIFYVGNTLLYLWGPLLYFFSVSSINKGFKFRTIHLVHIIPIIVHFTYMFFKFYRFNADVKQKLLSNGVLNIFENHAVYIIFHILIFVYVIAALFSLRKAYINLKNCYSNIEKLNLQWLVFILISFAVLGIFDVTYYTWGFFGQPPVILIQLVYPLIFLLANFIVYYALNQPGLFLIDFSLKYKKSNLSPLEKEQYLNQILSVVETEKLYKNPNLTINDLSEKLSISSRYISQVINEYKNQNFYDFINRFRINEACELLKQYTNDLTILEILFEVGFNTKSSFNTAFKRITKTTPTEFRRKFID